MKNFTSVPSSSPVRPRPSGGAGLQADIEALLAQACHAAPTVTALTVQDTVNVSDFRVLDREWVLAQANAVIADLPIAAVKLGMLGSVEMVETVLEIMARLPGVPLVCDPVLRAGGGGALGKDDRLRHARAAVPGFHHRHAESAGSSDPCRTAGGSADECAERLLPHIRHLLITGGHGDEAKCTTACIAATAVVTTSLARACRAAITAPAARLPAPWPVVWHWARS